MKLKFPLHFLTTRWRNVIKTSSKLLLRIPLKITSNYRPPQFLIFDPFGDSNYQIVCISCIQKPSCFSKLTKYEKILKHRKSVKFIEISHCNIHDVKILEDFLAIFENISTVRFFNCHFQLSFVCKIEICHKNLIKIEAKICNIYEVTNKVVGN